MSNQPSVEVSERVTLRNVAKSWYGGRVSVAVTGWSDVRFPEREAWWLSRRRGRGFLFDVSTSPDPTSPPTAPCSHLRCCARSHDLYQ